YDPTAGHDSSGCIKATRQLSVITKSTEDFTEEDDTLSVKDLESEAQTLGRRVGIVRDDAVHTYIDARWKLESGRAKLPLFGDDIAGGLAIAGAEILAIFVLAWLSFLLRTLSANAFASDEPLN